MVRRLHCFGYDDFNHLKSSSGAQGLQWIYDRFGNRWQQNYSNGTSAGAQLTFDAYNHIADTGFAYDLAGNLTNDGAHTYTFDAENRVTQVDGGTTAKYWYGPGGERVRTDTGSSFVEFVRDIDGHVHKLDSSHNLVDDQIWADGLHVGFYANSTTYFAHADWLGTQRKLTTVAGASYESYTSWPFGDNLNQTGTDLLHFTGNEHDAETGLDYFGARYYRSGHGRFLTADPLGGGLGYPQSLNLYVYVHDSPTTLTDPLGLQSPFNSQCGVRPCFSPNPFGPSTICNVDGNQVPCEVALAAIHDGAGVWCPLSDCLSVTSDYTGQLYQRVYGVIDSETWSEVSGTQVVIHQEVTYGWTYRPLPKPQGCGLDIVCHFFVGFVDAFLNGKVGGLARMAGSLAAGAGGSAVGAVLEGGAAAGAGAEAAEGAEESTLVIGKMGDLNAEGALADGERTLDLPDLGSPKANWTQNSSRLRGAMAEGKPIRDVSAEPFEAGRPANNTGFLRAERNLLENHGWTYHDGYWYPPSE